MNESKGQLPAAPWRSKLDRYSRTILWLALLVVPLVLALAWGAYFDDSVYVTLRYARNLATGQGPTYGLLPRGQTLLRSPIYMLVLWVLAKLGTPLLSAGLVLSALGWGAVSVAVYFFGRAMRRPVAAVVSAALVAFSPVIVSTLGTEIPWAVALAWLALGAAVNRRWRVQTGVLVLMLLVHFDLATLALAALILAVQWIETRGFPWRAGLAIAVAALGLALAAIWKLVAVPTLPHLGLDEWGHGLQRLLNESELYWLFVPLFLCGGICLFSTARRALGGGLGWVAISVLIGGLVARTATITLGLFLAGLGIDWLIECIKRRDVVRLDRWALAASVAAIAGLPLGIAQVSSLLHRYEFRPVARQELEQQAGDWLRAHSEPTARVFGSERLGYLAERPAFAWNGGESDQEELALLLRSLDKDPPDYCVSFRSVGWGYLMQTGWFRNGYELSQGFASSYDVTSPLTIWGRRPSVFDRGERRPSNVQLPNGVRLAGYKYWPKHVRPGGTVYVTLFLQATRPISGSFRAAVQMSLPEGAGDWMNWLQVDAAGDRSVPVGWWQPGQEIAHRFELRTDYDIPIGAYRLDVYVLAPDGTTFLPLYRDGETSPLDRILLGYVVVPWKGEADLEKPVGARFGDRIKLRSFEAPDVLSPGDEFEVVLYWEALQPPQDDYVVFLHLLDASGQLVASHDGPPMDGRYPTEAWLPGDIVPDTHQLTLAPDTPPGTCRLRVGMYNWPSRDRLPAWDSQGVEQTDWVVVLQDIEVR